MIGETQAITENQRLWKQQRTRPRKCRECGAPIVFLKNANGNYVPCDAVKKIIDDNRTRVMDEMGLILWMGPRKIGWPVHECKKKDEG